MFSRTQKVPANRYTVLTFFQPLRPFSRTYECTDKKRWGAEDISSFLSLLETKRNEPSSSSILLTLDLIITIWNIDWKRRRRRRNGFSPSFPWCSRVQTFPPLLLDEGKGEKRRRKMFILHLWGQGQRRPRILFFSLSKNESGYRSAQPLHFPHLLYYFYLRSLYSAPAPPELQQRGYTSPPLKAPNTSWSSSHQYSCVEGKGKWKRSERTVSSNRPTDARFPK